MCSVSTSTGALVRPLDDPPDLVVDLASDLLGVVGLVAEVASQERLARVAAERARAELLGHAPARDHALGGVGRLVEIVLGAGRDLFEHELLGSAAAQVLGQAVHQLDARAHELVLGRERDDVAERHAAADDGDLVHRVVVLEVVADQRVAHLVHRGDLALLRREQPGLLLGPGDDAHDALFELEVADLLGALAGGEQGRLVDEVGQVGAGEPRRLAGEGLEVDGGEPSACRGCAPPGSSCGRRGRAGRQRPGGRSDRGAAAPGRGCRGGWWRRSG